MKITKRKLIDLYQVLNSQDIKSLIGRNFTYACSRNKYLIEPEFKALQEAENPSEKFIEYENKKRELVLTYVEKDENNNPIAIGENTLKLKPENISKFSKEHEDLLKEYEDVIKENDEQQKEFQKILDEEIDLEFYMIKFEDVPENISYDIESKLYIIISPPKDEK